MRAYPLFSAAPRVLALTAALALSAPPMAPAQDNRSGPLAGDDPSQAPLAAVGGADEEERCQLITARRGEDAELVEEKSREKGREFPWLGSQAGLLEEFQVDEDERRTCAIAFGLAGGASAAVGGAAGTLAAAGIAAALGAGVITLVGGIAIVGALGPNNTNGPNNTGTPAGGGPQ